MAVQQDAWSGLKTQLLGDTVLSGYVKRFKWSSREDQFSFADFPLLICYPTGTDDEKYRGVPKQKNVNINISINGKVHGYNEDNLTMEILKFDEYIKNAIEKDLQLGGKGLIINIGNSDFNQLDNEIIESKFIVIITSNRFIAGNR